MSEQYGVVSDDGTITEYPTQKLAEKAGRIEALVVKHGEDWYYPTTGHKFSPEDVEGLSLATASQQAWDALVKAKVSRMVHGEVISRYTGDGKLVSTTMHFLKPSREVYTRWDSQLYKIQHQVLGALPGFHWSEKEGEEPYYNYIFLTVIRRRYPS